jgi:3-oxoadipate enol-lactonase
VTSDFRWPPPPDGRPDQPSNNRGPRSGRPTLPLPPTTLVGTPHGVELEVFATGAPEPVTVFAHGLSQGIGETRPLGSGVQGRKVFMHFRGHGRSSAPPGPWTYLDLARDLRAVADLSRATRALGVSLGAGALVRLLADNPTRFERVVIFLPAALVSPRPDAAERFDALLAAAEDEDPGGLAEVISLEVPAQIRATPTGWAYLRQRVEQIVHFGLAPELATLADQAPLASAKAVEALRAVTAEALVIGCHGDEVHPAEVASQLADVLPRASLHLYDTPHVMWNERGDVRTRVADFLNVR